MGTICSVQQASPEDVINQEIEKKNKDDYKDIGKEIRILLLGTGEAGKTTIAKQIQLAFVGDLSVEDRLVDVPIIFKQVIKNLKTLIRESPHFNTTLTFDQERATRITQIKDSITDTKFFTDQFTPEVWEDIKILWSDKSIQETFNNSHKFILDDSTKYFLDKVDTLKSKSYTPNDMDYIRSRVKSTAVVEKMFNYKTNAIRVIDVGGQRSERRKWIYCFPDMMALIFCVAISEYDQTLREQIETKRLDETFKVYDEVVNNRFFKNKPIIVFLNKNDIFEDKMKKRHISTYYPEFPSTASAADVIELLKKKFKALDKFPNLRQITFYVTVATNIDLFKPVFDAMYVNVLVTNLREAGFIVKAK